MLISTPKPNITSNNKFGDSELSSSKRSKTGESKINKTINEDQLSNNDKTQSHNI